jgi:hypothetical protein
MAQYFADEMRKTRILIKRNAQNMRLNLISVLSNRLPGTVTFDCTELAIKAAFLVKFPSGNLGTSPSFSVALPIDIPQNNDLKKTPTRYEIMAPLNYGDDDDDDNKDKANDNNYVCVGYADEVIHRFNGSAKVIAELLRLVRFNKGGESDDVAVSSDDEGESRDGERDSSDDSTLNTPIKSNQNAKKVGEIENIKEQRRAMGK